MKRDVFFVLIKASLNTACDNPQSPYACMVKNVEICRKDLPIAVDQCEEKMKTQLPAEIESEERGRWSTQVARCIVDDYHPSTPKVRYDPGLLRAAGIRHYRWSQIEGRAVSSQPNIAVRLDGLDR